MLHRVSFVALLAVVAGSAVAQPPSAGPNLTDAQGRKQGSWSKSWPTGKVRYTGQFKDDRPVGNFKHYTEEGVLATEQEFAADGLSSHARHFHANGQPMAIGNYLGQLKDSTWNYFDMEGRPQSVEHYHNGVLTGDRIVYYDNGGVAERCTFVDGERQGDWKQYFPGGTVKAQATYVKDEPEGTMTWFYPNGKKEIEGNVVRGERDGEWIYYNEDGSIQLTIAYRMGEMVNTNYLNGVFKEYYDDEQLKQEVTYMNGKKHGPFTEWHHNGKWVTRDVPPDPALGSGMETERVLQGQTRMREGTYKNDQLDGAVKIYGENGVLLRTETYSAGTLISSKP